MIKSMTGYGKTLLEQASKIITIEIRTLNSKQADIILKTPHLLREKETMIRSLLLDRLERGKVELSIITENLGNTANTELNKELALQYYNALKSLGGKIDDSTTDYMSIIVRMPEVLTQPKEELEETQWEQVREAIIGAIDQADEFRTHEGKALEQDLVNRINSITGLLARVDQFEERRIEKIRERLFKELTNLPDQIQFDRNRFEQELIYWLDKFDINEEKVRLKKHCEYFLETLDSDDSNGKKLGFISQEMGREINTLGAKANDEKIQRLVVQMKDELEKIKEQLFNIL
jgi:uncharacterized protein (TIGR00255 family)